MAGLVPTVSAEAVSRQAVTPGYPLVDGCVWGEVVLPPLRALLIRRQEGTVCVVVINQLAPPGRSPVKRKARAEKAHAEQLKNSGG